MGGGVFLGGALEDGYMKVANDHGVKFALMWANQDWCVHFGMHVRQALVAEGSVVLGQLNCNAWPIAAPLSLSVDKHIIFLFTGLTFILPSGDGMVAAGRKRRLQQRPASYSW